MDWSELFGLSLNPWELIVRGSALYWFLFLIFRVLMPRNIGSVTVADVLLLVLVADASQNAMTGDYRTVSDGFVLIGTLLGWNSLLDALTFYSPTMRRLLEPPPLLLIRRGEVLHRNLRREFIAFEELKAQLREHGIDDIRQVKAAYMESNGEFSVVRMDGGEVDTPPKSAKDRI